jgi:hypothetical protein
MGPIYPDEKLRNLTGLGGYMIVLGIVGWLISVVVFVVAVDYTAARINRVADEAVAMREVLSRIDSNLSGYINSDPHGSSERELAELNQTVLGGLTALIAIGSHAHVVDREKMTNEHWDSARETLTAFVGSYSLFSGWKRETEKMADDAWAALSPEEKKQVEEIGERSTSEWEEMQKKRRKRRKEEDKTEDDGAK